MWTFSSCDPKFCCILRFNLWIELIFCILIVMQWFSIRLMSYSIFLTFKCWRSNAVALVFLKLLMLPENVVSLNQISACIAYQTVAYKRHVMLSWRNNFPVRVFCVFILYFIWTIFPDRYFQKWGVGKNHKKGLHHMGSCL